MLNSISSARMPYTLLITFLADSAIARPSCSRVRKTRERDHLALLIFKKFCCRLPPTT